MFVALKHQRKLNVLSSIKQKDPFFLPKNPKGAAHQRIITAKIDERFIKFLVYLNKTLANNYEIEKK